MASHRVAIIGTGGLGFQFVFGESPDNHAAAVARRTGVRVDLRRPISERV
jgi:hypothetical protein